MRTTAARFGSHRFGSWRRWLLGVGPVVLATLLLVRATTPVIDPLLVGIFVLLIAATIALIAGSRVGAGVVLVLGLALFQPITAREFSFSLTAVDSDLWRVWAGVSLVALGWSLVAAVVEIAADATEPDLLAVVCTIGDHLSLGMAGVIEFQ